MKERITFRERAIPESYIEALRRVRENGGLIESVEKVESVLRQRVGNEMVLSTCNSTSALHLAMCALDLKRGDKVVCSVNAFADVPEVVRHFDAEPVFVDCDPRSYNMDLDKLDETLSRFKTRKMRAVVINHMAGLPIDIDRVHEIAQKHGVFVIEDATDAFGATYKGRVIGNGECEITVFGIGCKMDNIFDGGFMTFRSEECYSRAKLLRNHGITIDSDELDYLYDIEDIGCQYRMNEHSALYAETLLEKVDADIERRREIASVYFERLDGLRHLTLPLKSDEHIYTAFIVEIDKNRDAFARELIKEGIEVGLNYVPLHLTKYYKEKYEFKLFDFPNVLGVYQRVLSLPIHGGLSDEDVRRICDVVTEADRRHI